LEQAVHCGCELRAIAMSALGLSGDCLLHSIIFSLKRWLQCPEFAYKRAHDCPAAMEMAVITGMHAVVYTRNAEADRAFFRDVLGFSSVDAGGGWLILPRRPLNSPAIPPRAMANMSSISFATTCGRRLPVSARKGSHAALSATRDGASYRQCAFQAAVISGFMSHITQLYSAGPLRVRRPTFATHYFFCLQVHYPLRRRPDRVGLKANFAMFLKN
jgi:hypothetical protein